MRGDECQGQAKLVPSARNKPMHNARNKSKVKTLQEHLLKVKAVKLQRKNYTRLSDDENKYEGLYNEIKAWNPTLGSKAQARYMKMKLQLEQQGEAGKKL